MPTHGYYCICHTILVCYTMFSMSYFAYYDILSCIAYRWILCLLCHNKPTICQQSSLLENSDARLCLQSYSAHCGILCLQHSMSIVEMATAQRTRPRAVVGVPRRAAWQLKSALRNRVSAAPRVMIF